MGLDGTVHRRRLNHVHIRRATDFFNSLLNVASWLTRVREEQAVDLLQELTSDLCGWLPLCRFDVPPVSSSGLNESFPVM